MIYTSFYSNISLDSDDSILPDICHRESRYCKYVDFFYLWYLYVRTYLPKNEHIYILDNGSPIKIDEFLKWTNEPYEIISQDSYKYNPEIKLHVKQFPNRLVHRFGATRMLIEFIKMSYFNKQDFIMIEGDSLIAYNVIDDFVGYDYVVKSIRHTYPQSSDLFVSFVDKNNISNLISGGKFDFYLNHDRDSLAEFGEGDFYRCFCRDKTREISQPNKFIHDCSGYDLKNFILNNKINHPKVDEFLLKIDEKIRKGIC